MQTGGPSRIYLLVRMFWSRNRGPLGGLLSDLIPPLSQTRPLFPPQPLL